MKYKYELDRTSKKFNCPQCGRKTFVRFRDIDSGEYLSDEYGRCDRENSCQYFQYPLSEKSNEVKKPFEKIPEKPVEYLAMDLLKNSMAPAQNNFISFLESFIGPDATEEVRLRYLIGSSKHWTGATVFWQIDLLERLCYGKVMNYDPNTGRRNRDLDGRGQITAVHGLIGKRSMNYRQCLFGTHLLNEQPNAKVALVESEKTAVIASHFLPEYVWLATGGKHGAKLYDLNVVSPLKGRVVVLFPDIDGYEVWNRHAADITRLTTASVKVSQFLREIANQEQSNAGYDLADFLIEEQLKKKGSSRLHPHQHQPKSSIHAGLTA